MRFIAKHRHTITTILVFVCIGALVFLGVRMQHQEEETAQEETFAGNAMGTAVKKTIYAENPSQRAEINKEIDDCIKTLENQISIRVLDSEVALCNRNYAIDGIYELSSELVDYLNQEMDICEETDGAFSPCIRPLADLWGIEDGEQDIPEDDVILQTLDKVDISKLEIADSGILFHEEYMAIDFGAVGKGIACDQVVELFAEKNIPAAVVSIGGSIAVYGNKGKGEKWHIGIQNPRGEEGDVLGVLEFSGSKMISTSGDYEKYFEVDGKRYHHILDPRTGYPADNELMSVTIISDSGFLSDALSTACFVMGLDEGFAYAEKKGVEAVFVTKDKKVYITKALKRMFSLKEKDYELIK